METVTTDEAKETISLKTVKQTASNMARIFDYVRGSISWFGKEWLTPLDIKEKFKEAHIDISDEEIQIILHELSYFIIGKRKSQKSPITEVRFQDITRSNFLTSSNSGTSHIISETKHFG